MMRIPDQSEPLQGCCCPKPSGTDSGSAGVAEQEGLHHAAYFPLIDGLRFVAIFMVLFEHFGWYPGELISPGYYGVDLFLVISGFLITGILLRRSGETFGKEYRRFLIRRSLRIFPPYYALLLVLIICDFPPARQHAGYLAGYVYNYVAEDFRIAGYGNKLYYLWSLSLEEQFYLGWPLIVLLVKNNKRLLLVAAVLIISVSFSQLLFGLFPSLTKYNYTGLVNRMGSLGLGALGAIFVSWRGVPGKFLSSFPVEIGILTGSAGLLFVPAGVSLRPLLMSFCFLLLVLKAAYSGFETRWVQKFLSSRRVLYVGRISYGIYLFHIPLAVLLSRMFFDALWASIPFDAMGPLQKLRWHSWVIKFPLFSLAAIAVAAASYRWLEAPLLRLKKRWE